MHAPQTPLKLGPIPKRFRLPRGQALTCAQGTLWITSDALAGLGPDSDVVLESGQSFVTPQAATYFVGAPRGCGVLSLSSSGAFPRSLLEAAC
ncbi:MULTISPECIES: DUF2917 domain-containing protein [unclassified Polaromonas]|uniref:DUF2917 domain-containing protein n=1 Tax=unclassified Polaromonas TaxID=2638319 RepID=UPI000F091279|nr:MULTISPECIES: DUF2917 domain-containing protein [unclassified Polaromonas]AYQ27286.1 DUF2917 domain-containing protein [Polaromonas sp. SP1]QGJ17872.1 DUF2917 domain-containing protein [Polaromonas sp. Pch-P]